MSSSDVTRAILTSPSSRTGTAASSTAAVAAAAVAAAAAMQTTPSCGRYEATSRKYIPGLSFGHSVISNSSSSSSSGILVFVCKKIHESIKNISKSLGLKKKKILSSSSSSSSSISSSSSTTLPLP
uniref:Uncharacterized protein n=1 Tax=Vespula pensylvanica TaxID=30213 RepID=A0A834P9L4_VESPE|nr:hypothetical protein H0235_002169 [Vespula pensylvanica]